MRKKVLVIAAAMAAVLTGCQQMSVNDMVEKPEGVPSKVFTFHVKGDFTTSYEDMTRAAVRLENDNSAGLTDLWVLDYDESGKLVNQLHQTSTDADFGHPQMALAYGQHNVKFIASKGSEPSLTATAMSWGRVKDTFTLDYPVEVVASSNGNRAPELKRAVSGVTVVMTDVVPSNAKSIKVEYMRSQSLALPSLAASAASLSGVENDFPASWVGQAGSFSVYTLCPTEEMTTDVHVKVVATDGSTISDFTIEDVALKKNRMTTLKGECFGRGSGFSVSIDDSWDEPLEVTF